MKKLFLLFAAAISMLAFNSCQDSDDTPDAPESEGPNYLVMMYGVGGGELDGFILSNIMQAIDEGGNENVKMTFEYKLSYMYQGNLAFANFDGTRRFTYDDNAELTGTFKEISTSYPYLNDESAMYCVNNFKSEKIGDETYDIASPESLADFIKWSKEKYPNAKHTLLIMNDHGRGWDIAADGKLTTRTLFEDDNLDGKYFTDIDVMTGINNAGGVDVLYADACLMNMYENVYTYSKAAKYLLAAMEVAPGEGGDYRKLISVLKNANADEASMESAFCQYVDYNASAEWWGKNDMNYADLGFYNLTKLSNITTVLKKASNTLAEKFTSSESIQPAAAAPALGDNFAPYIRYAVNHCEIAQEHWVYKLDEIPNDLKPYVIADGLFDPETSLDEHYTYCDAPQLMYWLRVAPTPGALEAFEKYPEARKKLQNKILKNMLCSYSITHMLRILDNELNEVGAKNNPFKQLHIELLDAIKSVGHIACTTPKPRPDIDEAYELCSPCLVIIPLNSVSYQSDYNYAKYDLKDYNEALRIYQASEFDKQVGWSKFLQVLDVQPSPFTNITRQELEEAAETPFHIWGK